MSLYRSIIKDSWKSTLRNKYLWFFGLFAVLLGNGGEYEVIFRSIDNEGTLGSIFLAFFRELFLNLGNFLNIGERLVESPATTLFIMALYLFILVVFLFVVWMMNVSQVAIVSANASEARGRNHDLKSSLNNGIRYFWPVFSLNFLVKLSVFLVLYFLAVSYDFLVSVILFVLLIPIVISVSFSLKYAIVYIVVRKEKLFIAIKKGFDLYKKNWIISVELAFLLYLFTFVAGTLFMFASLNISFLFNLLSYEFPQASFIMQMTLKPNIILMFLIFMGSLLSVFQISAWTKLFLELDSKGGKSKIERVFGK